jgi:hypothetical protein
MFGGFAATDPRRGFQDSFRCHSVSLLAAEQQRDASRLEYSDKIILPPSCLEKLAQLEIQYPMMFQIANPRAADRKLHCGVLEFIAQEGMVYLPYWMMENMRLNEGDIVHLRSVCASGDGEANPATWRVLRGASLRCRADASTPSAMRLAPPGSAGALTRCLALCLTRSLTPPNRSLSTRART